jgi:hypothetical protein
MKVLAVVSILVLFGTVASAGEVQRERTSQITLRGQVVCSVCWDEANRTKVAYGTKDDLACARQCAAKGVPAALAVAEKGAIELYLLEDGKFPRKGAGRLDHTATRVEITGQVTRGEGLPRLKVDSLLPLPERSR